MMGWAGTLASPAFLSNANEPRHQRATEGDASVPSHPITTPAPTDACGKRELLNASQRTTSSGGCLKRWQLEAIILSAAKNLSSGHIEILRCAQN